MRKSGLISQAFTHVSPLRRRAPYCVPKTCHTQNGCEKMPRNLEGHVTAFEVHLTEGTYVLTTARTQHVGCRSTQLCNGRAASAETRLGKSNYRCAIWSDDYRRCVAAFIDKTDVRKHPNNQHNTKIAFGRKHFKTTVASAILTAALET